MNIETILFCFFVYAFLGWFGETIHESVTRRKFVNAGFLHGPLVPIYGVAGIIVITMDVFLQPLLPFPIRILIYSILMTALEYYTSVILEELFGIRLWDYSDRFLNLHGRICLRFSIYWLIVATSFFLFLEPSVSRLASKINVTLTHGINRILMVYFLFDLFFSVRAFNTFKVAIQTLHTTYLTITEHAYKKLLKSVSRLTTGFPHLSRYLTSNAGENILDSFHLNITGLKIKGLPKLHPEKQPEPFVPDEGERQVDKEWLDAVWDILEKEEFSQLKTFRRHTGTIFNHATTVSHLAWEICRKNGWDEVSAARGALLHDFFLYDSRNRIQEDGTKTKGFHTFTHAQYALDNAEKHFTLNAIEKDIIVTHMWPMTLHPPRFRETLLVTFLDKYISSKEKLFGKALKEIIPDNWREIRSSD